MVKYKSMFLLVKHVSDNLFIINVLNSISDRLGKDELKTHKMWPLASWSSQSKKTDIQESKY